MKRNCIIGEFMGAYYVEEQYARDDTVRRRYWFSKVDDSTLRYEGGMDYVNKRRVLQYKEPPSYVRDVIQQEGYTIR